MNKSIDRIDPSPTDLEPAAELHVQHLETLKVISDPLRARIVDLLRAQVQTVKQLADAVNLPPKKLYYHINLMEKHGLIRIVSTRLVSGIVEKSYRATAYLFLFDQEVFASEEESGDPPPIPALSYTFETTKNELKEGIQQGRVQLREDALPDQSLLSLWSLTRFTPEQAASFYKRLEELLEEFNDLPISSNEDETQKYRIFVTLFPVSSQS